ncbi:MAG: HEPN domain-containing protein [Lachnospiraceae bacterium]|nr:HEPN domain-containing protein [Lachnospiraceae bacterium]
MKAILTLWGCRICRGSRCARRGNIAYFRKEYIKTGIFPNELSDIIGTAFEIRNASDYDDMYIATKKEAEEQIERAKYFLEAIAPYIEVKSQK